MIDNNNELPQTLNKYFLVLISFVLSLIVYGLFLVPHHSHDSYVLYFNPSEHIIQSSALGRPLMSVITFILLELKINFFLHQSTFTVISLFISSIAVYGIYNIFSKLSDNKNKLLLFIGSFLVIFNIFAVEMFIYAYMLPFTSLSILLIVIAIKHIVKIENLIGFIVTTMLVTSSLLLYQGWGALFVSLGVLNIYYLSRDFSNKRKLKIYFLVLVSYGFSCLFNIIYIKFLHPLFFNRITDRTNDDIQLLNNIQEIIYSLKSIFITTFEMLPAFSFIIMTILLFIGLIWFGNSSKTKKNNGFQVVGVFSFSSLIILSLMPHLLTSTIWIVPRSIMALGALPALIILAISFYNLSKLKYRVMVAFTTSLFLLFSINTSIIASDQLVTNSLDREISREIDYKIKQIEMENNKVVENIAVRNDSLPTWCYENVRCFGDYNVRSLVKPVAPYVINFYTGRKFKPVDYSLDYDLNSNWDSFDQSQVTVVGNTVYIQIY